MTTPYWSDFVPNSTFYRILSGFHRTFATGVACRQGTLTPPDPWSCPIWDLQMFYCWDHWHSIIQYTTNSWPFPWLWLLTELDSFPWFDSTNSWPSPWFDFLNFTLLNIGFHWASATGVACWQGKLTPPDTWSRPFGTFKCSTCWDQSFSELVVVLPDYALRISLGTFSILPLGLSALFRTARKCSVKRSFNDLSVSATVSIRWHLLHSRSIVMFMEYSELPHKVPLR